MIRFVDERSDGGSSRVSFQTVNIFEVARGKVGRGEWAFPTSLAEDKDGIAVEPSLNSVSLITANNGAGRQLWFDHLTHQCV